MAKAKDVKKPAAAPVRVRRAVVAEVTAVDALEPEPTWQPGKLLSPGDATGSPPPPRGAALPPKPPEIRPTATLLGAQAMPRGRFAPRRAAIRPGARADDIFAEYNGALVQYRLENGTTLRKIEVIYDPEMEVQSSPALVPLGPDSFALYVVLYADERELASLTYQGGGVPVKVGSNTVQAKGGFLGDPVVLPGPTGNANVVGRLAIRVTGGAIIYDVAKDGSLTPTCKGNAIFPIGEVHGRLAGLSDPIANIFVPQSPIKNGFVSTGGASYGEKLLPSGPSEPNGDLCVINTTAPKTIFHIFVPSGPKTLYFHGTDTWVVEEIPFRIDGMAAERVTPNRTVVLGRMGQQLYGFSFDVTPDGKTKLNLPAAPFAQAITGDPILFRAYAPDGDVHLAALVYVEMNKLLYLWYDHGTDGWSLLPP